eukprot:COSAG02_NODE_12904_length_1474_cov_1.425455_2_plen_106_part_00
MSEGDRASSFYMIKTGEVTLTRSDNNGRMTTRIEGEFFGEIGLLHDDVCAFTATAHTVILSIPTTTKPNGCPLCLITQVSHNISSRSPTYLSVHTGMRGVRIGEV